MFNIDPNRYTPQQRVISAHGLHFMLLNLATLSANCVTGLRVGGGGGGCPPAVCPRGRGPSVGGGALVGGASWELVAPEPAGAP